MAKLTLKELAEQIKNKTKGQSSGGNQNWKLFYKFWSIPVDTIATVRFLPDANEDNPVSFFVENLTHELVINGKRETVACGKMHGDECPICKLSADYYDEKSPNHDRALGKKYYRKLSYIAQVMVIDSPIEHNQEQLVKLIDFGPQVFTQIQAGFASGDLEEVPYSLKGGHNFRFRKTKTGDGKNSYATSSFSPKQTDISDEVIEQLQLFNLADYRAPRVDKATLESMLLADQTGASFNSGAEAGDAPEPKAPVLQQTAEPTPSQVPENKSAEGGEKKLSMVEQLKARAAAARAAQGD